MVILFIAKKMVRNYYCDYCDKRLKDDVQIRKKHIEGLQHQKAMKEHYALYKCSETQSVHQVLITIITFVLLFFYLILSST